MSNQVLLEIGVEELPARFIDNAIDQLKRNFTTWLEENNISFDGITTYSTPRRLAVMIENISDEQETITRNIRGPQLKIARNADGEWSKAAIGFTKGQGKNIEDIFIATDNDNEYIFVEKVTEGKKTTSILPQIKDLIDMLHFPQTMRWGTNVYKFPRPIRWLTALYNDEVIPFELAGVVTGNTSYGHRFLGKQIIISDPLQYERLLEEQYVIADPLKREKMILDGIQKLEDKEAFNIPVDKGLLREVRNLVEYPTVFFGEFAEDYLSLPDEVLITSMKEHQRYFPVLNNDKTALLPYFVSVRNGNEIKINNVIRGNEKVLRARLADGAFFFEEDKKQSILFYNQKLKNVIFQEKIGTTYEKAEKVKSIASKILKELSIDLETTRDILRAAEISKFDLMTNMVNEFTELQGIMGEKYAHYFGEKEEVAKAIREQYLPLQSNGDLPETIQGAIVSVADKLDTIVGCFSVGIIPTGSQDPHGLRRQAIGILRIARQFKWNITIEKLIDITSSVYKLNNDDIVNKIRRFFIDRATYLLQGQHIELDVVNAVCSKDIGVFHYTIDKALLLSNKRSAEDFKETQESLVRVMNLAKKHTEFTDVKESLFETKSEKQLYDTLNKVTSSFEEANSTYQAHLSLKELSRLQEPIKQFFDHNMVMAKEVELKENRLALVGSISNLVELFADLTLIEWKQHHSN